MSELIKAAKQALEELQNARDHIWLLPENEQPLTDDEMLDKIRAAITALNQAIAEAEKQPVHASDISQERVDETAKREHEWFGLEEEEILKCFDSVALGQVKGDCVIDKHVNIFNAIRAIEAKLKEKNAA